MSQPLRTDIVMLAGEDFTSWAVYNHLVQAFGPFPVFVERHASRRAMVRTRIRKLGLMSALSQVAFVLTIRPVLRLASRARIHQICQQYGLETAIPAAQYIRQIESVNSPACREVLRGIAPKVVVVNGTRIIKGDILRASSATFLNIHQGVTPRYRGSNGCYWALYNDDPENSGVTIHVVDEGIDTGGVVARAHVTLEDADNVATYPYLQTAAAMKPLTVAIRETLAGRLRTISPDGPSAVWYHPGFFQYLLGRRRGVR